MKRIGPTMLLLAGVCLFGCGRQEPTAASPTNTTSSTESGNPLTAPVDYLGAVNQARKSSLKTLDQVTLKQAIQQFQVGEERNPDSLQELVSKGYLPKLPEPPPGMKLDYNPKSGEVKLVPRQ